MSEEADGTFSTRRWEHAYYIDYGSPPPLAFLAFRLANTFSVLPEPPAHVNRRTSRRHTSTTSVSPSPLEPAWKEGRKGMRLNPS
ncbi:superoxide dismutase [Rhodotorula toruloides ATCC 204091]|uniref:Superoxide dismutase n=1 Tax=Rhodotorula toruloides TaxID=5286 RepID=A0A2T0A5B4_RHOTO|nr:superoxide dismutase [Rhodotorula toruloides ATCC 204091]PRQ73160.1 superoxide dismutase [Rhodotorula toruloides]